MFFLRTLPLRFYCVWCRKNGKEGFCHKEETVKTGFCHESVRKQEVFASKKKTRSYWWKMAPHQPVTKLYGKTHDLVAEEQGKVVGATAAKE